MLHTPMASRNCTNAAATLFGPQGNSDGGVRHQRDREEQGNYQHEGGWHPADRGGGVDGMHHAESLLTNHNASLHPETGLTWLTN